MTLQRLLIFALLVTWAGCSASPQAPPPPVPPPEVPAVPQLGVLSAAAGSTDKGPSQHNYTELYERLLFQWKNDPIKIFEIGIAEGGSLAMWQTYFPNARIFAVDILEKSTFDNARVTTLVADQADRDQLQKAIDASGSDIHVLIDDGGHTMKQQQVSLGFLFRHVRPGGYYIIEDVHTSLPALWKGYGVARDGRNTTLRMLENFVRSSSPAIRSEYMLESEMAYLTEHIESVTITHRPKSRSIVCVLKKKA
jgi:demethylmacrocin O-methyltransferase